MKKFSIRLGFNGLSTYDYVINQRISKTVNQTLFQFNLLNRPSNNDSSGLSSSVVTLPKLNTQKVSSYRLYFLPFSDIVYL